MDGGGGAGGRGGTEEGEVEHEVSGLEVRGRPGQVEREGYVVGLEGGEGCGEVGCAVGMMAISALLISLISISNLFSQGKHLQSLHGGVGREVNLSAPELQMQNPLHAILRHIVVVEERVGYARDAEEEDAGCGEEEGAEVGSLGGLGGGGVDGEEGCFLDGLSCLLF